MPSSVTDRRSITVLNVADRDHERDERTRALTRLGYRVLEAAKAEEALSLARQLQPDVIVLHLQGLDTPGPEVCRQLKADAGTAGIPLLHLAASAFVAEVVRALDNGAEASLTPPVAPAVIAATIDSLARARRAEETAARVAARGAAMIEASRRLGASLDYETTLASLPGLLVPALADGCAIDILEEDGQPWRIGVASVDPEWRRIADELRRRYPLPADAPYGVAKVLRSGEREFVSRVTEAELAAVAQGPEHLALLQRLRIASLIIVPLTVRDSVFGALTLIRGPESVPYREDDLAFAEELAARAAVAVDNARLYGKAQQAERRKDEFLAILAHELRNPLASVVNALHVLERTSSPEPGAVRMRGIIRRQTLHLARLVDDLLDVSRVQLGKIALDRTAIDLNDTARRAFESLHASGKAAAHDVAVMLAARAVVVEGDAVRLEQVLGNLLDNAVKYSPAGAAIRVTVVTEGDEALVRVTDRGIGIGAEDLGRIFDLFSQAERTLDRARGGLGLGLPLARALVELHGGRITAASAGPGQGSEFVVRLPLLSAPHAPDLAASGRDGAILRRRILVIEDNEDARDALRTLLELNGHEVAVAADGASGLATAAAWRPDVALVDIGLPGLDGYEVCRRLRDTPAGEGVCMIALTGYGQPEDHAATAAAGFDAHLVKPVEPEALERAIATLVPGG